jgi:hypothetical protein
MLIIVVLAIAAYYMRWFGVSTSTDAAGDSSNIELTVNKGKFKDDVGRAASKAEEVGTKAKDGMARKTDNSTESRDTQLLLDKTAIDLDSGSRADVTVTRAGGDTKQLQLGLIPSSGSNLLASGGLFKDGETSAVITVEAPKTARTGKITIEAGTNTVFLTVTMKP